MTGKWNYVKNFLVPTGQNQYRPKIWTGRFWLYCLVVIVVLKIAALGFLFGFKNSLYFADVSRVALVELTNQERVSRGLNPLKESETLNQAAAMKARDMLSQGYFSHQSPAGLTPWFWFKQSGYQYKVAGENLGIGFINSSEVHQAWVDSPSHRANIISPYYQEIGIAVIEGNYKGSPVTLVVQLFGTPLKPIAAKTQITSAPSTTSLAMATATSNIPSGQVLAAATTAEAEKNSPIATSDVVLLPTPADTTSASPLITITPIRFEVLKYIDSHYGQLTQRLNLLTLLMVLAVAVVNILVAYRIQHRDLIIKSLALAFLFFVLLAFNDQNIMAIVPHNLRIN